MSLKETVFEIISVLAARLSGQKSGRNAVLIGTIAGDRIVQPQQTLVLVRHFYVDQTTSSTIHVIESFVELLGLKNALELKDYVLEIYLRMVTGSDITAPDNIAIQLYSAGAVQITTLQNIGYLTETVLNGIEFHLDADHDELRTDATDWSAAETHSYVVTTKFYRLTDGIGRFSL